MIDKTNDTHADIPTYTPYGYGTVGDCDGVGVLSGYAVRAGVADKLGLRVSVAGGVYSIFVAVGLLLSLGLLVAVAEGDLLLVGDGGADRLALGDSVLTGISSTTH